MTIIPKSIKIDLSKWSLKTKLSTSQSFLLLLSNISILSSHNEHQLTNALFSSAFNWISNGACYKLFFSEFFIIWQVDKKNTFALFDETIKKLGHTFSTCLNGQEPCKKKTFCLGSFDVKKESTDIEKPKTKGVLKWRFKLFFCLEGSGVYSHANRRTFLLSKKVSFMAIFAY